MGKIVEFWKEEDGAAIVEIILLLVIIVGLALIFKKQITSLVNSLLGKITQQSNTL